MTEEASRRVLRFEVPTLPKTALSPNERPHWTKKATATKELRAEGLHYAREALCGRSGFARAKVGVEYRHTFGRPRDGHYRPLDEGNATAALKPLLDGLVDAGVVPDDKAPLMELERTRIVRVDAYEDEGLNVTIEEL